MSDVKVSTAPEDVENLIACDDHERNTCQARYAECTCGYEERKDATLRALSAEVERLKNVNRAAANFLTLTARRLDGWAQESKTGGWPTHQVKANTDTADHCRKYADAIRAALGE